MNLGEMMLLVMRMQADARRLAEAIANYTDWQDIPGANAEWCESWADNQVFQLGMMRDTLHAEHAAKLQAADSEAH